MPASAPSSRWLETANRLSTVATELSNVVHEINNMLQIVAGSAEMIALQLDSRDLVERRAGVITAQAHRASELLADVLAFARNAAVEPAPVDLREVVESALALRRYSLGKGRIESTVDAGDGEWTVTANRGQLLQLVLNLIINAEQALAGRPGGRLRMSLARAGDRVILTIEDDGPGLPPVHSAELFSDPVPIAGAPPRLGIGLRVAAWLAQEHSGSLELRRLAEGGTAAVLSLPA